MTEEGERKVLLVKVERNTSKKPLIAYFGGISLKWNKWVSINENLTKPIWSKHSEVVQRLLAQKCELCGSQKSIEVHHIRHLADLKQKGRTTGLNGKGEWQQDNAKHLLSVNYATRISTMANMTGKNFQRKDYWRAA